MNPFFKTAVILIGVALIAGCVMEPDAPILFSPQDGEVFVFDPPTFIWSSDSVADGYEVMINDTLAFIGGATLYHHRTDTSYTLDQGYFDAYENGTYYWTAASYIYDRDSAFALYYDDIRSFVIDKPESSELGLDTTYFPFNEDCRWCYEKHTWYRIIGWGPGEDTSWDKYDTFTVDVVDTWWERNTFWVRVYKDIYGLANPLKIWDNQIEVFGKPIGLIPQIQDTVVELFRFRVAYDGDTLTVSSIEYSPYSDDWSITDHTTRLKGIGATSQGRRLYTDDEGIIEDDGFADRLLWFYNGKDTVYKVSP